MWESGNGEWGLVSVSWLRGFLPDWFSRTGERSVDGFPDPGWSSRSESSGI